MVTLQNKNSEIISANQAALENTGLTASEIAGKRCFDIWGNKQNACADCSVQNAILTGRTQEFEHISPDNRNWIIKGCPVRSGEGEIIGAVEIIRNVTLLKQKERQLRLTQFSIDNLTDPVYWVAADGSFVYANNTVLQFLGYSKEEFIQLYVYEVDTLLTSAIGSAFWMHFRKSGYYNVITEQKKKITN